MLTRRQNNIVKISFDILSYYIKRVVQIVGIDSYQGPSAHPIFDTQSYITIRRDIDNLFQQGISIWSSLSDILPLLLILLCVASR